MFDLLKRINRKTYWLGLTIYFFGLALWLLLILILPLSEDNNFEPLFDIPLTILILTIAWFGVCITRQRANDIDGDHPLRWMFFSLFLIGPIIGFIYGDKVKNKYGPQPQGINLLSKSSNDLPRLTKIQTVEYIGNSIVGIAFITILFLMIAGAILR